MLRVAVLGLFAIALGTAGLAQQQASRALGASLRVLDKTTGAVTDIDMMGGTAQEVGLLSIRLGECRYPAGNPNGDAFAQLSITYQNVEAPTFDGWMIASAPALNAMDHPRYDVWVLRCITS